MKYTRLVVFRVRNADLLIRYVSIYRSNCFNSNPKGWDIAGMSLNECVESFSILHSITHKLNLVLAYGISLLLPAFYMLPHRQ